MYGDADSADRDEPSVAPASRRGSSPLGGHIPPRFESGGASLRIGVVAYWFNRGQAVVARQIRETLDGLGHETFVLARPSRKTNIRPERIDTGDVWAQDGVTAASDYLIPWSEYEAWATGNRLDLVMFDQNYQFEEIERLRAIGVRTVGRFVWEHFSEEHVEPARRAFDVVYSLTACERERYAAMGIESPRVRWGCWPGTGRVVSQLAESPPAGPAAVDTPTTLGAAGVPHHRATRGTGSPPGAPDPTPPDGEARVSNRDRSAAASGQRAGGTGREAEDSPGVISFLFPGGYMSKRKPLAETIEAFRAARGDSLRLLVKAQVERQAKRVRRMIRGGSRLPLPWRVDRRIELITADLPHADYMAMFAAADICIAPSRWEGLGLHLYEATALGVPIVTNDNPPMNEVVLDGVNGLLVPGIPDDRYVPRSGITGYRPDVPALTAAIERLADPDLRAELAAGARRRAGELSWEKTTTDLAALIATAMEGASG